MSTEMDTTQKLVSAFNRQKCWMITPLAEQINYSIPSARRFLAQIGYYSSFTHNGRWYTLSSIPRFKQDGLWFHRKIGFSHEGSLTGTLVRLIEKSPMGLTAEQIGEKVKCRCHAVLVKLYRESRLQRQKQGRSYVYLAVDEQIASIQRLALPEAHIPKLPAEMAVLLLAEFIRTPDSEIQQLAKTISHRTGVLIKQEQVQRLFEQHGLKKSLNYGERALIALDQCLTQLKQETLPGILFQRPLVIRFRPDQNICQCGTVLVVLKTRCKKVKSITGPFKAHETLLTCPKCDRVFTSQSLRRLVAKHCNVAWNVVVFVGQSLFQHHRTTEQVRQDLQTRHVTLSPSEIEYLGRKFITYLALGHRQATPHIKQTMRQNGGYILHLDATHEADAPALMTGMDALTRFVLGNIKIPSEHADRIVPFLQQLKCDYGVPIACVHDMGTGILKAVAQIFPDTRDFICHFHFLRDVGKDLLNPAYAQLRKALRTHAATTNLNALIRQARQHIEKQNADTAWLALSIRDGKDLGEIEQVSVISAYSLALWCLNGKKSGNGFGFPFDRPLLEFAQRLVTLNDYLPEVQQWLPDNDLIGKRLFAKLANNNGSDSF